MQWVSEVIVDGSMEDLMWMLATAGFGALDDTCTAPMALDTRIVDVGCILQDDELPWMRVYSDRRGEAHVKAGSVRLRDAQHLDHDGL
jgi:hypothetical protein